MRRTGHSSYSITRGRGGPRGGWQRGPTGHGPVGRWGQSATVSGQRVATQKQLVVVVVVVDSSSGRWGSSRVYLDKLLWRGEAHAVVYSRQVPQVEEIVELWRCRRQLLDNGLIQIEGHLRQHRDGGLDGFSERQRMTGEDGVVDMMQRCFWWERHVEHREQRYEPRIHLAAMRAVRQRQSGIMMTRTIALRHRVFEVFLRPGRPNETLV